VTGSADASRSVTNVTGPAPPPTDPVPAVVEGVDWARLGVEHPAPYTFRLAIDESHLGQRIRHVPNTEYVRWFEACAIGHSDALGYTQAWHESRHLIWFVRRHEVDYLAEVFEGDDLILATWVEATEKSRSHRRYVVYRPADERVIARALTIWVLVDLATRRPVRVESRIARRYEHGRPDA